MSRGKDVLIASLKRDVEKANKRAAGLRQIAAVQPTRSGMQEYIRQAKYEEANAKNYQKRIDLLRKSDL